MPVKEPIAIVGMGCRLPGSSDSPEQFWDLISKGRDAIIDVPADRWNLDAFYDPNPGRQGKSYSKWGGFVDGVDQFDPEFFGISPREADFMDPQQRLLLEAAWRALEDAGYPLDLRKGAHAGVFAGVSTTDYAILQSITADSPSGDIFSATGSATSIVANRVSYCLNLTGPSLSVDTACSSSLIAVHLACNSLWRNETPMALAGGVNAILGPMAYLAFCRMSMLSPTGRCKAFDSRADGFVRGEGAGMVVLKKLSRALADGDRVYALIAGTAANQDGRTNGITVPSATAQEALVREACRNAGVDPASIDYIEAHGTGTPVGDPIEAHALGSALGEGRPAGQKCLMGSVKTNIGHLEAGAGIAGLIKVALVLRNGVIPQNLHFLQPNPHIDFERLKLQVVRETQEWPESDRVRRAGINSFGFGGANAHAILEAAPAPQRTKARKSRSVFGKTVLVPLSARTPETLPRVVESFKGLIASEEADLISLCQNVTQRRAQHDHRIVVRGDSRADLVQELDRFLAGEATPSVVSGHSGGDRSGSPVFVFSGQGPQWWGMGRELMQEEPVFRQMIERCDQLFRSFGAWSLIEELSRDEAASRMQETAIAQPAIFALQVALAELWKSWGVTPAAVVGHSVGEVAAVYTAGILSLEQAAHVIYQRGRCMELAPERGRMLAVGMSAAEAERILLRFGGKIEIGAYNSPVSLTLTGQGEALEAVQQELSARQVFARFLQVQYAFHSRQMDPIRDELLRSIGPLDLCPARIPILSTVTGQPAEASQFGTEYWWDNVRKAVHFSQAIDSLIQKNHAGFVECSAHPALVLSINECLNHRQRKGTVVASLRRQEPERAGMLSAFSTLSTEGWAIDWKSIYGAVSRRMPLPAHPWQKKKFWHEPDGSRQLRLESPPHPYLIRDMRTAHPTWSAWLDKQGIPYLNDHRLQGHMVFPAAAYIDTVLGAVRHIHGDKVVAIEDMDFQKALFIPESNETPQLQFAYRPAENAFTFSSRTPDTPEWSVHCVGKVRTIAEPVPVDGIDIEAVKARAQHVIPADKIYEGYRIIGFQYGPLFQGLKTIWRRDGEALGRVELPEPLHAEEGKYYVHPALLDATFQILPLAQPASRIDERRMFLPIGVDRLRFFRRPGKAVWCYGRIVEDGGRLAMAELKLLDDDGSVLIHLWGFRSQAMPRAKAGITDHVEDWLYESKWILQPRAGSEPAEVPAEFFPAPSETSRWLGSISGAGPLRRRTAENLNRLALLFAREAFEAALGKGKVSAPAWRAFCRRFPAADRWRARLESAGWLRQRGTRMAWSKDAMGSAEQAWREAFNADPGLYPEWIWLRRAGRRLAALWKSEGGDVLTPENSTTLLEHFYQDSFTWRGVNACVARAAAQLIERMPAGRVLRVLEVGGGTGGLTAAILDRLPVDRIQYTFTDRDEACITRAEQKFFEHRCLSFRAFDASRSLEEQGISRRSFDLVIGSDLLRWAADPGRVARHLSECLAPGGRLLYWEPAGMPAWLELVFAGSMEPEKCAAISAWHGQDASASFSKHGFSSVLCSGPSGEWLVPGHLVVASVPAASDKLERPDPFRKNGHSDAWIVFSDREGFGGAVAKMLRRCGDLAIEVEPGTQFEQCEAERFQVRPGHAEDLRRILAHARTEWGRIDRIVHCWSLNADLADKPRDLEFQAAEAQGCDTALVLIQELAKLDGAAPKVSFITRGVAPIDDQPVSVAQAPLWGLCRTLVTEQRKFGCRLVDLSSAQSPDEVHEAILELKGAPDETEVAFRNGFRWVNRLARVSFEKLPVGDRSGIPYRLEIPVPGVMDRLTFQSKPRRKPGRGEVEIEIRAAALNFRDVMKALGIYPVETDLDLFPGDECSGRIVAIGRGVKNFSIGDEVIAMGSGCFSSHMTIEAAVVMPKPKHLSYEEAVTLPVAYLTAYYALHHLGNLKSGESVLVQAATGGVGLAAVQLAQLAGARVFATAGSAEKRELLRSMGVEGVFDSRSLNFSEQVIHATGGKGVDLVLNSLSGAAIAKGIACLAPHGRFLEIGKRDIFANTHIGLRPFRKNLSMHVIDLGSILQQRQPIVPVLLGKIMGLFRTGRLKPLPYRTFPVSRVVAAFRQMAQARHLGKIVLSMENPTPLPVQVPAPARKFSDKATYLVTGGLGGFGLALAEWLVREGARTIVLTGRSGAASDAAKAGVRKLRKAGARVVVVKADVAKKTDVERLFNRIARTLPPLKGIFHTAMVLDDGIALQLTPERFRTVLAPKVTGGWLLHCFSRELALDHFVLFSSVSSLMGSAGQANYVAANAFLDSLAQYRRRLGLSGLAVNWGHIAEVGYVSRHGKIEEHLNRHGVLGVTPAQATEMLGRLLFTETAQVGVMKMDWAKMAQSSPGVFSAPRFSELLQGGGAGGEGGENLREKVMATPEEERLALVASHLKEQVAKVLRVAASHLDSDRPLNELGLDSLMAFELLTRVETQFGISIPPGRMGASSVTINKLAAALLGIILGTAGDDTSGAADQKDPQKASPDSILPLRAGSGNRPVFCIHPAGGFAEIYRPLVDALGGQSPVYGLQSRGVVHGDGLEVPNLDLLAAHYAELIESKQPDGPLTLVGFSLGAIFAAAASNLLEKKGRRVELLGIIDADLRLTDPGYSKLDYLRGHIEDMYLTFERELRLVRPLPDAELEQQAAMLASDLIPMSGEERIERVLRWLREGNYWHGHIPAELVSTYLGLFNQHTGLITGARIAPISGRIVHWRSSSSDPVGSEAPLWRENALGGYEERIVDGSHYRLMYPPIAGQIASELERELGEGKQPLGRSRRVSATRGSAKAASTWDRASN